MTITTANVTSTTSNVYVSNGNTAITWLSITNYSAANVTTTFWVVPSGDAASNLNMMLANIEIAASDTYQLYAAGEKLLLSNGDSVQADASTDNAINAVTSYTTV